MRLINVETLEMKEFFDDSLPSYAILSHTWGSDEVSFQDWQTVADFPALLEASRPFSERLGVMDPFTALQQAKVNTITCRAGYQKILGFCRAVCRLEIPLRPCWAWVDTCCIDKKSSAELSEAINSMFRWYQNSGICLVYLSDVSGDIQPPFRPDSAFHTSRWFSRGWTLQELLAPTKLRFYNQDWEPIGWTSKYGQVSQVLEAVQIAPIIAQITGIPEGIISGDRGLYDASISAKMSWVSKRQTTRTEDMSYCLLGLFGVQMPLLYGEGPRAFTRLQEEIIKVFVDHTIFAWRYGMDLPESGITQYDFLQPMAKSPADFVRGSQLKSSHFTSDLSRKAGSFQSTNMGLHIRLPIFVLHPAGGELHDLYFALLNCIVPGQDTSSSHELALALPLFGNDETYGTLKDDTSLRPIQGGMPVPVSLPLQYPPTNYHRLITRRIFIPRLRLKDSFTARKNMEGRVAGDVILHMRNPVAIGTPWTVAEAFPPLVRAIRDSEPLIYRDIRDLAPPTSSNTLAGFPTLKSTYVFGPWARKNSPKDALSTLPHFFRLRGDRDLVLAVEIERPLKSEKGPRVRVCISEMPPAPQQSLLSEFLNGGLGQGSKRCEWNELADASTKRFDVGGFHYDVCLDSTTLRPTLPHIWPLPTDETTTITIFVTSLPAHPTICEDVDPRSNDETTTTLPLPPTAPISPTSAGEVEPRSNDETTTTSLSPPTAPE